MSNGTENQPRVHAASKRKAKQPFYKTLWGQVLIGVALAIIYGKYFPASAVKMKPLGDGFIKLITMVITVIIFCTVVSGIAGMENLKKVGRIGGKALLYFEVVSTFALFTGMFVGNVTHPGSGFNVNVASLDAKSVAAYAGAAKEQSVQDFLMNIIPTTMVNAFAQGNILQVLLVAVLFGFALSLIGEKGKPVVQFFDSLTQAVFSIVNMLMWLAPIGAFGAMAFTVGRYGISSLGPLGKLIGIFYVTCLVFVLVVMGVIAWISGFNIIQFLRYIKEEIVIVLATSSSDPALPTLMEKMEKLGCSKSLVGLVVPTGYTFNTDGSSLYMTMAALFVAQATNIHLSFGQQLTIFGVAVLTSKGASGVTGAAFIALVATLMVIPDVPVAGMALLVGIDRFMSMARATVNMIGNGVASVVVARWENELDKATLRKNLSQTYALSPTAPE
ncbi:MAG TPA: dicarboxylate/amino acid:cation symporter [Candidatus Acidoferrales bacterium]|nr:dicarboxylate/amino acid:cation symporter [Candidatus Acidoferrales bacterium]